MSFILLVLLYFISIADFVSCGGCSFATPSSLYFSTTEKELEKFCNNSDIYLQNMEVVSGQCTQLTENKIHLIIEGQRQLVHAVCEDTDYKQNYLAHAPCLFNVSENILGRCSAIYDSISQTTEDVCCAYYSSHSCLRNDSNRICGENATYLLMDIMGKSEGSTIQDFCSDVNQSDVCNGCGDFFNSSNLFRITFANLLLVIYIK